MSAGETALQAVCTWIAQNADPAGTLSPGQVIVADPDAPRPAKPYVAVQMRNAGLVEGMDETIDDLSSGSPRRRVNGIRRATFTVQGYGSGSLAWIERAVLRLGLLSVADTFAAAGVDLPVVTSGVADVATLLGTSWESRYSVDIDVTYGLRTADSDAVSPIALTTVDSNTTLTDTTPTDLVVDQTITI